MPSRDRYPRNWAQIALNKKQAANWTCEACGRLCKRPDEAWMDFVQRVVFDRYACECAEAIELLEELADKRTRFALSVAHMDRNPGNNAPENLKALCSVCHLQHDAPFRALNASRKRERRGQLSLFDLVPPAPAGHGKDPDRIQSPLRTHDHHETPNY